MKQEKLALMKQWVESLRPLTPSHYDPLSISRGQFIAFPAISALNGAQSVPVNQKQITFNPSTLRT